MVESMTIQEFLDVLSSKEPVPGGGGASALAGALGNALGQMVANLTIARRSTRWWRMRLRNWQSG